MFVPIYQLNTNDSTNYTSRWETLEGNEKREYVIELIKGGAGEDFLQTSVEYGELKGFLEDMWDLRGIHISLGDIEFPTGDTFEAIDFSYARFYNSTFRNCYFRCLFNFTEFHYCNFVNCTFHITSWLGCTFENCSFQEVDFIEYCIFNNSVFTNTKFKNYSISNVIFSDCKFDSTVEIDAPSLKPVIPNGPNIKFDTKQLNDYYQSISEAYKSGAVTERARDYYFQARYAFTKYNNKGAINYLYNKFLIELLTGYGVRPFRTLISMFLFVLLFAGIYFSYSHDFYYSVLNSISAFFTMGDASIFPWPYNFVYLFEGFIGVFIMGLYLITLAKVWFSE